MMWDDVRHGADRGQPEEGAGEDPAAARGVLAERERAGRRRRSSTRRWSRPAASPTSWSSRELLCHDALDRKESCGGHFREEYQTPDGEAKRDDENFCYVAAWEYKGAGKPPELHKEPLTFEDVQAIGADLQVITP